MLSNLLILCHPLLLLPSVLPSIRVFSSESVLHIRWPKYWSFNFSSVLPMNIQDFLYWLDFFNWLDLLALQGTLKSLFQHHNSKASVLQCSAFFMVHLSHPSMTTGKTIALTMWNFVGKVVFLLFNILSRFVIAFLPRSEHLLFSWLQSLSAVHYRYLINTWWTHKYIETPILWPPDAKNWLIWKDPDAGKDWRREEKGSTEDEMVGWHHWLDRHEFE